MDGQLHIPAALTSVRALGIHYTGGWVGPRIGLDTVKKKKMLFHRDSNRSRPTRNLSLYGLIYHDY
jgi:hypothetical protein